MLPHARVLLHQPSAGGQGTLPDLALQAKEIVRLRAEMEEMLARHTGQTLERLREDTDRDKVFTADRCAGIRARRRDHCQPQARRCLSAAVRCAEPVQAAPNVR